MLQNLLLEIMKFIGELGYFSIFLLSALESTAFPVVIPVETVIIPMGYYAYLGQKNLFILIFATTSGIIVGCLLNYFCARILGRALVYKLAKYLFLKPEHLQSWEQKFLKNGKSLLFFGRFIPIPAVKHIITIPAGMAKMPVGIFTFYTALGGFIFSTAMILVGYFFGSNTKLVKKILENATIFVCLVIAVYFFLKSCAWFIRRKIEKKKINSSNQ